MGNCRLRFLLITVAATAFLAAAAARPPSSRWVPVPNVEKDPHVQSLGEFAVKRYDEQNHAELEFLQVVCAVVLDRGTEHYTYKLVVQALDDYRVRYYDVAVLQDLSAPGQPPVLNLGSFVPTYYVPPSPSWIHIPSDHGVQDLGAFAVKRHDEQTHAELRFLQVVDAQVLDRGTEHYTFHLIVKVLDLNAVKYFKVEVFQDLSAPGHPPVLDLGYLVPE